MATWKKLGGQTDEHLGNTDLTISGSISRKLNLDNVGGSLVVEDYASNTVLSLSTTFLSYGNESSTILHQFKTYNSGAEGGAGAGMEVTFGPSDFIVRKCDSFTIESNENDSSAEPRLILRRNNQDALVVDNDSLADIVFQGRRSNGSGETYASIAAVARDVTAGTEDGELNLKVKTAGTELTALSLKSLSEVSDVKADSVEVYGETLSSLIRKEKTHFSISGELLASNGGETLYGDTWYDEPIVEYVAQKDGDITSVSIRYAQQLGWHMNNIGIRVYVNGIVQQGGNISFTVPPDGTEFDLYASKSNVAHFDTPISFSSGDVITVTWRDGIVQAVLDRIMNIGATVSMVHYD